LSKNRNEMNFHVFRKVFLEFTCFTSHQVYAWYPDFDKNNLSRWVKKGFLIRGFKKNKSNTLKKRLSLNF